MLNWPTTLERFQVFQATNLNELKTDYLGLLLKAMQT